MRNRERKRLRNLAGSQPGWADRAPAPKALETLPALSPNSSLSSAKPSLPSPTPTPIRQAPTPSLFPPHGTKAHGKGQLQEHLRLRHRSQESPQHRRRKWEYLQLPLRLWPLQREENQVENDLNERGWEGLWGTLDWRRGCELPLCLVHEGQETMGHLGPPPTSSLLTPRSVSPAPLFSERLGKSLFVEDGKTVHRSPILSQSWAPLRGSWPEQGGSGTLSPLGMPYWDSPITQSLGLMVGDNWGRHSPGAQQGQVPALPVTCCVALGKSLPFSGLYNGD